MIDHCIHTEREPFLDIQLVPVKIMSPPQVSAISRLSLRQNVNALRERGQVNSIVSINKEVWQIFRVIVEGLNKSLVNRCPSRVGLLYVWIACGLSIEEHLGSINSQYEHLRRMDSPSHSHQIPFVVPKECFSLVNRPTNSLQNRQFVRRIPCRICSVDPDISTCKVHQCLRSRYPTNLLLEEEWVYGCEPNRVHSCCKSSTLSRGGQVHTSNLGCIFHPVWFESVRPLSILLCE